MNTTMDHKQDHELSIWLLFQFQKQHTSFNSGLLSMTTFHGSCSIPQAVKYPRRSLQHLENSKFLWPLSTSLVYDLWSGPRAVNWAHEMALNFPIPLFYTIKASNLRGPYRYVAKIIHRPLV